jgi:hypothetical protein
LRTRAVSTAPTLTEKIAGLFGAKPKPLPRPTTSQPDRLFLAMRDNLLFEWQLRLIPYYVGLPVTLVQALGARLLEFREIEDIQWMVRTGQPLLAPTQRRPETATAPPPSLVEQTPEEQDVAPLAVPEGVSPQRFVGAVLNQVNPRVARWLARETQLNPRQLALMLIRAYEALPASDFQRFGASEPGSDEARRFLTAARAARFGQDTSPAVTAEFARLHQARIKSLI